MTPKELARAKEIAANMRSAHMQKQNAAKAQEMLLKMTERLKAQEVIAVTVRSKAHG